jgi:hypothetical protein
LIAAVLLMPFLTAAVKPPDTLGGMTLGARMQPVTIAGAQKYQRVTGWVWMWKRPEGGAFTVHTDRNGIITSIEFTADKGEQGTIDLPCAGELDIQDSHVNLQMAVDPRRCTQAGLSTYTLPDDSILNVEFEGPGDGQLLKAEWYRPSALASPAPSLSPGALRRL